MVNQSLRRKPGVRTETVYDFCLQAAPAAGSVLPKKPGAGRLLHPIVNPVRAALGIHYDQLMQTPHRTEKERPLRIPGRHEKSILVPEESSTGLGQSCQRDPLVRGRDPLPEQIRRRAVGRDDSRPFSGSHWIAVRRPFRNDGDGRSLALPPGRQPGRQHRDHPGHIRG